METGLRPLQKTPQKLTQLKRIATMTTETIYSLDDLFDTDSEHDQVSAEEDKFIYEMLANYDDDEDFLSEIYSELYGE